MPAVARVGERNWTTERGGRIEIFIGRRRSQELVESVNEGLPRADEVRISHLQIVGHVGIRQPVLHIHPHILPTETGVSKYPLTLNRVVSSPFCSPYLRIPRPLIAVALALRVSVRHVHLLLQHWFSQIFLVKTVRDYGSLGKETVKGGQSFRIPQAHVGRHREEAILEEIVLETAVREGRGPAYVVRGDPGPCIVEVVMVFPVVGHIPPVGLQVVSFLLLDVLLRRRP